MNVVFFKDVDLSRGFEQFGNDGGKQSFESSKG